MTDVYLRSIEPFIPIIIGCMYWKTCGLIADNSERRKVGEHRDQAGGDHNAELLRKSETWQSQSMRSL